MTSRNYTFKFSGTKFSVDIGKSFCGASLPESEKGSAVAKLSHYHAKCELFFVGDDPITIHTPEKATQYRRCTVFVPPFCRHTTVRSKDYRILFSFETKAQNACDFSDFCNSFFASRDIFSFEFDPAFEVYLSRLGQLITEGDNLHNEAAAAILSLIFCSIYENNAKKHRPDGSVPGSYLLTIEQIINSYSLSPSRKVTLGEVAAALHLGNKQTSRIIYKYFGKSLAELVTEKRLSVASNLLLTTNLPISEVANEANFNSENYFYIQFRKAFGCTPLAYRKQGGTDK